MLLFLKGRVVGAHHRLPQRIVPEQQWWTQRYIIYLAPLSALGSFGSSPGAIMELRAYCRWFIGPGVYIHSALPPGRPLPFAGIYNKLTAVQPRHLGKEITRHGDIHHWFVRSSVAAFISMTFNVSLQANKFTTECKYLIVRSSFSIFSAFSQKIIHGAC